MIAREVIVADHVSAELLGPGDLLPWQPASKTGLLPVEVVWSVLSPTLLAVLDRRFAAELARWPEVTAALFDRLSERSLRLATTQAISQLTRVDRRLRALFWHLAERWGRVSGDGVVVPLALTHRILGQLVGARRPTVSTALGELAERGELVRRPDGSWILRGSPPDASGLEGKRSLTGRCCRPAAPRPCPSLRCSRATGAAAASPRRPATSPPVPTASASGRCCGATRPSSGSCREAGDQLAHAQRPARAWVQRWRARAGTGADALEQLEQCVAGVVPRLPAQFSRACW